MKHSNKPSILSIEMSYFTIFISSLFFFVDFQHFFCHFVFLVNWKTKFKYCTGFTFFSSNGNLKHCQFLLVWCVFLLDFKFCLSFTNFTDQKTIQNTKYSVCFSFFIFIGKMKHELQWNTFHFSIKSKQIIITTSMFQIIKGIP